MKMIEEGSAAERRFAAIERSVQRVSKFAGIGIAGRTPSDSGGSGVKISAIRGEEMLPCGLTSCSTGVGQSEIIQIQAAQIGIDLLRGRSSGSEGLFDAALEGCCKALEGEIPTSGL